MGRIDKVVTGVATVIALVAVGVASSAATRNTIDAELRAGCTRDGQPGDRLVRVKDSLYRCTYVREATDADRS